MKQYLKILPIYIVLCSGCSKFLDSKPDKQLAVPSTLQDLQALLDNNSVMNKSASLGIGSADDYYLTDANWASLESPADQQTYIWGDEVIYDNATNDWETDYQIVYTANTILESLNTISISDINKKNWENIKGSALFFRALAFHDLSTIWSVSYDSLTAGTDLGIPLRLSSDFNEKSVRSTVKDSYSQILEDLMAALPLLPQNVTWPTRPSKQAAYGLLSRIYLAMRNYKMSLLYADSCLAINSNLMDFNNLSLRASYPISRFNSEVIFHSSILQPALLGNSRAFTDSNLYNMYGSNDLRRDVYFKTIGSEIHSFKGSYNQSNILFSGIATDEIILNKAECNVRLGNINDAMNNLNTLLINRWRSGTFVPISSISDSQQALNLVLEERRKELVMRHTRWMDIKRLNKEGKIIIPKRFLNGQFYQLEPNSPKYALPIPIYVVQLSGIQQN